MLTKIKMLLTEIKHLYCCYVVRHYVDKADKFVKMGDYEHACKCWAIVRKYLEKQTALWSELLEMA